MQVKIATRAADGEKMLDLGKVSIRVQTKTQVQVFQDGKLVPQEQWQDQQVKTLANEEGFFELHANQRLVVEESA